jgi:hypothetical protein
MQPNGVPMQYQSPRKVQLKHNCDAFSLMGSLASVNTTGLSHLSARNTNRIWNAITLDSGPVLPCGSWPGSGSARRAVAKKGVRQPARPPAPVGNNNLGEEPPNTNIVDITRVERGRTEHGDEAQPGHGVELGDEQAATLHTSRTPVESLWSACTHRSSKGPLALSEGSGPRDDSDDDADADAGDRDTDKVSSDEPVAEQAINQASIVQQLAAALGSERGAGGTAVVTELAQCLTKERAVFLHLVELMAAMAPDDDHAVRPLGRVVAEQQAMSL